MKKRLLGGMLLVALTAAGWGAGWMVGAPSAIAGGRTATPTPVTGGLPGRATATPPSETPIAPPTALLTPVVTSPFTFPTAPPDLSPTPGSDCTAIFPLDNVEAIAFGTTTLTQLQASFGRPTHQSGRANRFRFEEDGCTLIVLIGVDEALEAELTGYGTLGWLLDRYGAPAAAGVSQGNLTLLDVGHAVLFYPERGLIALFDAAPDDLTRETPVARLIFRLPFQVEAQLRRLNVRPLDAWQPPD